MSKRCNTVLHVTIILCVLLFLCFSIQSVIADEVSELTSSAISDSESELLSALPISFTENMGQAPEEIAFLIQSAEYLFGFTYDGFYFIPSQEPSETRSIDTLPVTRMRIEGADPDSSLKGTDLLAGVVHYLIGPDESEWITDVPTYESITYDAILPGVSLTYFGTEGVLKREFVLDPGIAPESIVLVYEGVESLELAEDGTLLVHTTSGVMDESAPVSYQMVNNVRVDLFSNFVLLPENKVSFNVDGYDPSLPLIVDPFLYYSTMLGGKMDDHALDMALDKDGNVYLTGYTQSSNFPRQSEIQTSTYDGSVMKSNTDAFVTKIGTSGLGNASVMFSTFLGGNGLDAGRGIAVDQSGNVYVAGETASTNFPIHNPLQAPPRNGGVYGGGASDAFVTKLNANGKSFIYSTYIGGAGTDAANAIFVDSTGTAYITGKTRGNSALPTSASTRYPTTSEAYQTVPSSVNTAQYDAFVSVIEDKRGRAFLSYSTYLGGNGEDVGKDIVADGSGNIYVIGTTNSNNLVPAGVPGHQKALGGSKDAFIFKLNPSATAGNQVVYATYLGGTLIEEGEAITIDSSNLVYVTGTTTSTNFPVTTNAFQSMKASRLQVFDTDIFVSKISADGRQLLYSTYLGGIANDGVYDIALDSQNQVYIAGYTYSTDYPLSGDTFKDITSARDAIVTVLDTTATSKNDQLAFSTNFGGYADDVATAVRVSKTGEVYVTGYSNSPTLQQLGCDPKCFNQGFITLRWINQGPYNGGGNSGRNDAFVIKFSPATRPAFEIDFTVEPRVWVPSDWIKFTPELVDGYGLITGADIDWVWSVKGPQTGRIYPDSSGYAPFTVPGKFDVTLKACIRTTACPTTPCSGQVCVPVTKDFYLVIEDPNACIAVKDSTGIATVLENESFKMEWKGKEPLPDRILWEFIPSETRGGEPKSFTSSSLTPYVPDGLLSGDYHVKATPFYDVYPPPEKLPGTAKSTETTGACPGFSWIKVIERPTIWFANTSNEADLHPGPLYVEKGTRVYFAIMNEFTQVHDIQQTTQWDYDDRTPSSGWLTGGSWYKTDHIYDKVGKYCPVVTVKSKVLSIDVKSEKKDENCVIVYEKVIPDFECTPNPALVGETVTCLDQSSGVPEKWVWDIYNTSTSVLQTTSTLQHLTYTFSTPGEYVVWFGVTGIAGEVAWKDHTIKIIPANGAYIPTLTWRPMTVPVARSSVRDVSMMLDSPILGLVAVEFTATITDTTVAAFTGKSTPGSWGERFTVTPVGSPLSPTGNPPLYESVKVYGVTSPSPSFPGTIPNSTVPLELGKLQIAGIADGITYIRYLSPEIWYGPPTDEQYHVKLENAKITVGGQSHGVLPLPGMSGPQADLNNDGFIDDFNGDGEVNALDVIAFFDAYVYARQHLSPGSAYDYNRNGRLDIDDVVAFFDYWKTLDILTMTFEDDSYGG